MAKFPETTTLGSGASRAESRRATAASSTTCTRSPPPRSGSPPRVQEAMAARIPDAELVWFEDAGHLLPVEDPEGVASSIADFLARRVDGPPKVSAN